MNVFDNESQKIAEGVIKELKAENEKLKKMLSDAIETIERYGESYASDSGYTCCDECTVRFTDKCPSGKRDAKEEDFNGCLRYRIREKLEQLMKGGAE